MLVFVLVAIFSVGKGHELVSSWIFEYLWLVPWIDLTYYYLFLYAVRLMQEHWEMSVSVLF